jgi:hypothetical protein
MPAQPFGRRVHDDVGAMLERAAQVRRGEGAVDHQRQAGRMRHLGHRRQIQHLKTGISDHFSKY